MSRGAARNFNKIKHSNCPLLILRLTLIIQFLPAESFANIRKQVDLESPEKVKAVGVLQDYCYGGEVSSEVTPDRVVRLRSVRFGHLQYIDGGTQPRPSLQ